MAVTGNIIASAGNILADNGGISATTGVPTIPPAGQIRGARGTGFVSVLAQTGNIAAEGVGGVIYSGDPTVSIGGGIVRCSPSSTTAPPLGEFDWSDGYRGNSKRMFITCSEFIINGGNLPSGALDAQVGIGKETFGVGTALNTNELGMCITLPATTFGGGLAVAMTYPRGFSTSKLIPCGFRIPQNVTCCIVQNQVSAAPFLIEMLCISCVPIDITTSPVVPTGIVSSWERNNSTSLDVLANTPQNTATATHWTGTVGASDTGGDGSVTAPFQILNVYFELVAPGGQIPAGVGLVGFWIEIERA